VVVAFCLRIEKRRHTGPSLEDRKVTNFLAAVTLLIHSKTISTGANYANPYPFIHHTTPNSTQEANQCKSHFNEWSNRCSNKPQAEILQRLSHSLSRILRRRTTSSNLLKLQLPLIHLLKFPRCSLQLPSNPLLQLLAILRTLVSLIIGQWSQTIVRINFFFVLFVRGCTSLCAVGPFGSWLLTFGRRPGVSKPLERRWCSSGWDGGSSTSCSYGEI